MLDRYTASFLACAIEMSSASRGDCAVTFCSAVLKLSDPSASMNKQPEVDLPLSGLFPQLASQYPVIYETTCLVRDCQAHNSL